MRSADPLRRPLSRRRLIQASGLTLAGGSAALLAACGDDDSAATDEENDARVLNSVLAFEFAAASAYKQLLPLLQGPARAATQQFGKQDLVHATALTGAISDIGGTPVKPKTDQQYAQLLGLEDVKTEPAALDFLAELEQWGIFTYIEAVPKITNHDLRTLAAEVATNDAQHSSVLVGARSGEDPGKQAPQALVTGVKPPVNF
jgi:Ferritin-like domain